ncbi:hypothetical protein SAMN05421874_128112 [Nonomuraea maritima]|uniref:Uncharacterized protein n=1 Tax=Nonomuraea maritima TaxID=683260 RepID=A0A1G9MP61_9ACTN|nr:hypothetical protein [Nonomuraea maritima]SDL75697.1 hypothetical protein SAMN05421874_128112 [Nonomuraea maritima]
MKKNHSRPVDVGLHYVARPEPDDDTPTIIILSSPHGPFKDGVAYQGYAYLAGHLGRMHWSLAGGVHDDPDDCLAAAIAHARVLRDQDKPPLPRRHTPMIAGLLLLAYELADNGLQERAR